MNPGSPGTSPVLLYVASGAALDVLEEALTVLQAAQRARAAVAKVLLVTQGAPQLELRLGDDLF